MRRLYTIAPALLLTLIPVLLAGWTAHEHGAERQLGGYECEAEHLVDAAVRGSASGPGLYGNGDRHRHDCVACMAWGDRSLVECATYLLSGLLPRITPARITVLLPQWQELPSSLSLRGPPA